MDISLIAKLKDTKAFVDNYLDGDEKKEFYGKSLLFYSLSNNDLKSRYEISAFLLEKGADVKVVNEENESLLHILLSRTRHDLEKTTSLCKQLVDSGVNVNQIDKKGRVALQYLINMKYTDKELEPLYDIFFCLPKLNVSVKNKWGKSPIDIAEQMPYRKEAVERMKKYE